MLSSNCTVGIFLPSLFYCDFISCIIPLLVSVLLFPNFPHTCFLTFYSQLAIYQLTISAFLLIATLSGSSTTVQLKTAKLRKSGAALYKSLGEKSWEIKGGSQE